MERSTRKPRALVVSFSNLGTDPRVHRQIALLTDRFAVTAIGHAPPVVPGVTFCAVPEHHWTGIRKLAAALLLKLGRFEQAYWSSQSVQAGSTSLKEERFDLIVANDIFALPLALSLRKDARILFDAHEYAPLEFEESWRWRVFLQDFNVYLCRHYLPLADAATTVCEGIVEEYRRTLGVQMKVIHNAPPYQDLHPSSAKADDPLRLVHHGTAIPSRQLETMIETMRHLDDRYTLDFVLVPGNPRYLDLLKSLASDNQRIRFLPPVGMHDLPRFLNRYDAGFYLLPPNNFNNRHSLPNKFFEFIQARLAIAIGPSPEMARLVRQYGCGVVAEDFSPRTLAALLNSLSHAQIDRFKQQSHAAAADLCFEKNSVILRDTIDSLIGRG